MSIFRLNLLFLILSPILPSCGLEDVDVDNIKNKVISRDIFNFKDNLAIDSKSAIIQDKFEQLIDRKRNPVYLFDFGLEQSPYIEGTVVVTPSNRNKYYYWVNKLNISCEDQGLINPVFTDFIAGKNLNEIVFYLPPERYEITFISGSNRHNVPPFRIKINDEEFLIKGKEFNNLASQKGYYSFNTIYKIIKNSEGVIKVRFLDDWLVNAIILAPAVDFEIKTYSGLTHFEFTPDFYNLLTRENGIKWSVKFGYDYANNWDYVIYRIDQILNESGLREADHFTKIKYIADYVDRLTRETCCEVLPIDILNSPVDILDPDGYKKGSCFGLARLVGIMANSYGIPARLIGYFIDSDFAEFSSLFPQISAPLFAVRPNFPYSTFAIGGYNHTEVEIFYGGKWRLITNYIFEDHLTDFSAIDVVNNRDIPSVKRSFYDNVQDVMYVNLFIANTNREEDYCELPYTYAFYDLDTARTLYPENMEWGFKTDNHTTGSNSLRIGRYWSLRNTLKLQYNWVKRIGREFFVPSLQDDEELILNLMISVSNRSIEENLDIYVNDVKVDYISYDRIYNFDFQNRDGGVLQFRVRIDKDRILQQSLNTFDVELKDSDSEVGIIIGKNNNRISDYETFTMDYCNKWDMMRSSNSYYYYSDGNKHPLYNNPLLFLEIVKK